MKYELVSLVKAGESISGAARKLGVSEQAAHAWVKGWRHPETLELWERMKGDHASAFENAMWEALGIAQGRMGEATYRDLIRAAAVCLTASRLARGDSTTKVVTTHQHELPIDTRHLTDDELLNLRALILAASTRRQAAERDDARITVHAASGGPDGSGAGENQLRPVQPPVLGDLEPR